jgi:hypothetical protein
MSALGSFRPSLHVDASFCTTSFDFISYCMNLLRMNKLLYPGAKSISSHAPQSVPKSRQIERLGDAVAWCRVWGASLPRCAPKGPKFVFLV